MNAKPKEVPTPRIPSRSCTFFDEKKGNDVPLTCPWSLSFSKIYFIPTPTKIVKGGMIWCLYVYRKIP